jgi:hypothetical protein
MAANNPIVEIYKGITIRKSNVYKLRINAVKFKMLVLESERTGLPISKILAYSSRPCDRCPSMEVITYNQNSDQVKIKRGILAEQMPKRNGTSIINQTNAKKL